jgi:hypothetical protein
MKVLAAIALVAAGLIVDAATGMWWIAHPDRLAMVIASHAMGAALAAWGLWLGLGGRVAPGAAPGFWLPFAVSLSFPVAGILSAAMILLMLGFVRQETRHGPEAIVGDPFLEAQQLGDPQHAPVRSTVIQVLNGIDVEARRDAVLSLRAVPSERSVLILKKALRDSDDHVRAYAENQLQRMRERSENRIRSFEARHQAAKADAKVRVLLGETLFEEVQLGMAEREITEPLLRRVVELTEPVPLESRFGPKARILALRSNLLLGRPEKAEAQLEALAAAGIVHPGTAVWQLEALHLRREFSTLRLACLSLRGAPEVSGVSDVVAFWASGKEAVHG